VTQANAKSELLTMLETQSDLEKLLAKTLGSVKVNAPAESPGMVPDNLQGLLRIAQLYLASGFVPMVGERRDERRPPTLEQLVVIFQRGYEIGLQPSQALDGIAIIRGRVTVWGDTAKGLCYRSGLLVEDTEVIEGDGDKMVAICRVRRKDQTAWHERRFSAADAKRASLWGNAGPWTNYPDRMLMMRARGFALRDKFPDVLKGLYLSEEFGVIQDASPDRPTGEPTENKAVSQAVKALGKIADRAAPTKEPEPVTETTESKPAEQGSGDSDTKPRADDADAIVDLYHFDAQADPDAGGFVAFCRELPHVGGKGKTKDEAIAFARKAAVHEVGCILDEHGTPPQPVAVPPKQETKGLDPDALRLTADPVPKSEPKKGSRKP